MKKMITGLLQPTSGKILFEGHPVERDPLLSGGAGHGLGSGPGKGLADGGDPAVNSR